MRLPILAVAIVTTMAACSSPVGADARDAAVWVSTDGYDWERVCHPSLGGPGEQQMLGVASSGSLLVAVGTEVVDGEREAVAWVSDDGRNWRRSGSEDLTGPGEQWLVDVGHTDLGWVAVGSIGRTRDQDAAVWTSPDGRAWTKATSIPSFHGAGHQSANTVMQWGSVVYVGGRDVNDGTLWRSIDAVSWESVDAPGLGGEGVQGVFDLAVIGRDMLAFGESGNDAAVWALDGSDWVAVDSPKVFGGYGRQQVGSVAVAGEQAVAVGFEFTYDRIFLGGGAEGTQDGAVWTMDSTGEWARISGSDSFAGIGEQAVVRAIDWEHGFMAVGYDLAGRGSVEEGIAGFGSGLDVDAAVWLSADGVEWTRVTDPSFGGDDWQDMYGVVEAPQGGLVAVGGDDLATACG
jgi:hypothetical protein